ncbi:HET-domain-containing protein [Athelia psychrophila]|uniref:HET-domain-containing protein n=1 Tax=Athelia psychrophila TaxID=1759441 RepID=A0A166CS83_9AGAM|nr:HET-domain-containing protein [Fibularhizoctonia sp. CBS 109695]
MFDSPHPRVHKPTFKDLKDSAVTCESCAIMERALPLEAPDVNNQQHALTAESGPVILKGDADKEGGLRTLSTIWVNCGLSRGELNVFNVDPNRRVVAGDKIVPGAVASYPFIQERLSICDAEHADHCYPPISLDTKDPRVPPPRLYSIRDRCIQDASLLPKNVQYIALSYTWGKPFPDAIKTLKANIAARQVQNEFDLPNTAECPATYRTAVEVTEGLGLSYIWIDSICMIQDDDDDRDRHFKRFDEGVGQIYQNARLTICAMGSDTTCNILEPRKLPDAVEMAEIPLDGGQVAILSNAIQLHHYLAKKRGWNTRGWTFQEWLLSPRLAYFTESQVFFECRTLFEEGRGTSHSLDQNERYKLREEVDGRMLEVWDNIVTQYSGRFLGYWSDRLNAIRSVGMQLVMRIREKTGRDVKFCSGLLSERLHIGLLWQRSSHAGSKRITAEEWAKGHEPAPPSWSWACWTGGIIWEWYLRTPSSGIEVSSIDDNQIELVKPELLDCKIGQPLDLQTYEKEVGFKTGHQWHKMQNWSQTFALLRPEDGSIMGRASFDDPNSQETSVECLVVSYNPNRIPPYEETESINVLLVRKEKELGYIRLGVGEIFVRTGKGLASLPDHAGENTRKLKTHSPPPPECLGLFPKIMQKRLTTLQLRNVNTGGIGQFSILEKPSKIEIG